MGETSNKEKKPFRIVITDNRTDENILEGDFDAIIAGISFEEYAHSKFMTECGLFEIAYAVRAAQDALQQAYEDYPGIIPLVDALRNMERAAEEENNEEE